MEIVLAPPFTALHAAAEAARNSNVAIAAQDLYWEREGAFTGEVSAPMIREAGAEYVIIGHSERRTLFGETDATVNRKAVGGVRGRADADRLHRRDARSARARTRRSTCSTGRSSRGWTASPAEQLALLVIAYEPVWAIGTGRNATPAQAAEAHGHIRQRLRQWFGADAAEHCHVIYGGSVKPENIRGSDRSAGRGRRAGGRRQPRCAGVFRDRRRAKPAPAAGIIGVFP